MKSYDKYELQRIRKRLNMLIFGDSSDEPSGLSLVQLREKKSEYGVEYDDRKAKIYDAVWRYEDCRYDEISVSEKAANEVDKFIQKLWESFIPKPGKSVSGYINKSLKRIIDRMNGKILRTEGLEYKDSDFGNSKIDKEDIVERYTPVEQDYELPLRELFLRIQEKFDKCQDRSGKNTKKYLSALLTYRLVRERKRIGKLDMLFFDVMSEYNFCDQFVLEECRNIYNEEGKLPKQKEVAAKFVRDSTGNGRGGDDASRYLKPFVKIIRNMC